MKLIENYIFRRALRAFLLTLGVLSATVWISQALREFDLVTAKGQTLITFFQVTLLLLPALATVVSPVALIIAVIYTFRTLNEGSELAVINASGAPQMMLLKPVVVIGLIAATFIGSMTLYFSPLSLKVWRAMITDVRGNVIASILREGEFMSLAEGLTFHLRQRKRDGTLEGIFVSDSREPKETATYLAKQGALLDGPLGVFLVMNDGTIQRRNHEDKSISIIEFTSYAFDLSTLSSQTAVPPLQPQERSTTYLFNPDPSDRYYQKFPGKFRAELHYRLTAPLNALMFAMLPLVFLGQAETTRQQRSATTMLTVVVATALAVTQFVLLGVTEDHAAAVVVIYAIPLLVSALCVFLVLTGRQPKPPERLIALGDALSDRLSGMFRRPAASAAGGS